MSPGPLGAPLAPFCPEPLCPESDGPPLLGVENGVCHEERLLEGTGLLEEDELLEEDDPLEGEELVEELPPLPFFEAESVHALIAEFVKGVCPDEVAVDDELLDELVVVVDCDHARAQSNNTAATIDPSCRFIFPSLPSLLAVARYGTTRMSRGWSRTFCAIFLPLITSL